VTLSTFEDEILIATGYYPNFHSYFHVVVRLNKVGTKLKGQSHEKVGEMSVEGDGLGPN
jgi:hypothetical protein